MKITPCKKAEKPSLPPAKPALTEREILQHLGGECYPIVNDDFKCEVANWLKALNKDTTWLAEQCRVTKKTVERWLMPWTHIPAARENRIRTLMKERWRVSTPHKAGLR